MDCVTVVWGKGTLVTHVLEVESVELTDARTVTIGYFMRRKYIHTYIHTLLHSSPLGALPPYIHELK